MESAKKLMVDLGERSYPIWIGQHILEDVPAYLSEWNIKTDQKLLIVTDENIAPLYGRTLKDRLVSAGYSVFIFVIPAGEASKSLAVYEQIMTYAMEEKLNRNSIILALGGGVVGDLAGFVASTYMRGIPFIQLPTTLLAHDSSVGGKVAINHPLGKNMIGSFYQPLAVLYDTHTLSSLPERELRSGFAEVLKHGLIRDELFAAWLMENRKECQELKEPYISEAILRACHIKTEVVSADEKEQGVRAILNLGHTFGHAFEALSAYGTYTHGEAISIGMVLAARVSELLDHTPNLEERVVALLGAYGLPTTWKDLPWSIEEVLEKMYSDKKVLGDSLNLTLLDRIGAAKLVKGVDPAVVKQVWYT